MFSQHQGGGEGNWFGPRDIGVVIYMWLIGLVIRGTMIAFFWPYISYFERATPAGKRLGRNEYIFITWGGLRGALGTWMM